MVRNLLLSTALATIALATVANAGPLTMRITATGTGGGTVTVTDDGAGDIQGGIGALFVSLSSLFPGAWFGGNISSTISNSTQVGDGFAHLGTVAHVGRVGGSLAQGGGTITIEVSDQNYFAPNGVAQVVQDFSLSALNAGASGSFAAYQNNANLLLDANIAGGNLLQSGTFDDVGDDQGPFSNLLNGVATPYALYHVITITQNAVQGSFEDNVNLTTDLFVPEPATMTLLGLGLAGLGIATRRRRKIA